MRLGIQNELCSIKVINFHDLSIDSYFLAGFIPTSEPITHTNSSSSQQSSENTHLPAYF